jgi:hypothetical protein
MAGSPHQFDAGVPANAVEHSPEAYEVAQERLDPASISVLIDFFKLLDQWDREATRQ